MFGLAQEGHCLKASVGLRSRHWPKVALLLTSNSSRVANLFADWRSLTAFVVPGDATLVLEYINIQNQDGIIRDPIL